MKPIGFIDGGSMREMLDIPEIYIFDNKYGRSSEIIASRVYGRVVFFPVDRGLNHITTVPSINWRSVIGDFCEQRREPVMAV